VAPPCINLAPSGAPSNKPILVQSTAAGSSKPKGSRAGRRGSSSTTKGGKGPGSKGGIGMKSCESFVVSPDPHKPLVAFLGDAGHIGLVSLGSRASVGSLKMNGSARAAAFSADGSTLITAGEGRARRLSQGEGEGGQQSCMLWLQQPCVLRLHALSEARHVCSSSSNAAV
jgi:hypothetical protein